MEVISPINGVNGLNGVNGGVKTRVNGISGQRTQSVTFDDVEVTADWLLSRTKHTPEIGIICGSGLGGLVDMLDDQQSFLYKDIPGFPVSTAPGHAGRLVFGKLAGKTCVCMQGRVHLYEGYPAHKVVFPVRVMRQMGVSVLIATNAAGGLNPAFKVGDLMMFKDHINLPGMCGMNPLLGPNDNRFGPRFPPLSDAYDQELRKVAKECAAELGYDFVREGVYVIQSGPCYETVTESKLLQLLGADVTGMSTVPEVITGRHCGMRCFAMSLVTNECVLEYDSSITANEEEVVETGKQHGKFLQKLIALMVKKMQLHQ